ncbi:MAG: hypothetical protein V1865_00745, partial [bacterium]
RTGQLKFYETDNSSSSNSGWVGFKAPKVVESSVTWTLPAKDGNNDQVMVTNGQGTLDWVDRTDDDWFFNDQFNSMYTFGPQFDGFQTRGNVGVGTDVPTKKLEVVGGFKSDSYYANDPAGITRTGITESVCVYGRTGDILLVFVKGLYTGYVSGCP